MDGWVQTGAVFQDGAGNSLTRYDAMVAAIDACHDVDEVHEIRSQALAMEEYARQARNTEAERKATVVRLRAERRFGQLRRAEVRNAGCFRNAPLETREQYEEVPTNTERRRVLGISRSQDVRWQKLGAVSEDVFAQGLTAPKPSSLGILRAAGRAEDRRQPAGMGLYNRVRHFGRILESDPAELVGTMTDKMQADLVKLAPRVAAFLERVASAAEEARVKTAALAARARPPSQESLRPWEVKGMSRTSWFRQQANGSSDSTKGD